MWICIIIQYPEKVTRLKRAYSKDAREKHLIRNLIPEPCGRQYIYVRKDIDEKKTEVRVRCCLDSLVNASYKGAGYHFSPQR